MEYYESITISKLISNIPTRLSALITLRREIMNIFMNALFYYVIFVQQRYHAVPAWQVGSVAFVNVAHVLVMQHHTLYMFYAIIFFTSM